MKTVRIMVLTAFLLLLGTWAYADDCGGGWRYADNLDGTITDCRTGLIWLKNANCTDSLGLPGIDKSAGHLTWYDAMRWAAALSTGHCGLADGSDAGFWRLPTKTEWMAMVAGGKSKQFTNPVLTDWTGAAQWTNGNPFFNVQPGGVYWSSTTNMSNIEAAWAVNMGGGNVGSYYKSSSIFVWPMRAGQVAGNDASVGTVTVE